MDAALAVPFAWRFPARNSPWRLPPRRPIERPFSWHAPSESRGSRLSSQASVAVDPQKQAKMLAQFRRGNWGQIPFLMHLNDGVLVGE